MTERDYQLLQDLVAHLRAPISRRELLKWAGTASISIAAADLIAACQSVSNSQGSQTPKYGGTLRIGINTRIRGLDPHAVRDAEETMIMHLFGESLYEWKPDGSIAPALATSFQANADKTEWTFKIRPGVTFHNGEPVTAEAVAASMQHQANPKTVGLFGYRVGFIDSVTATNSDTVLFKLKEPYARFDQVVADPELIVIPPSTFATANTQPIGTGPWKFDSMVEGGSKATLKKNPNYWRSGRPYIDTIEVNVIPDAATREASLVAGQIDLMYWLPVDAVSRLKATPDVTVFDAKANHWQPICMHTKKEPFTDPNVRQAMQYLVDRDEVVSVALFGEGSAVNGFPEVPDLSLYPKQVPKPGKDLQKAKDLLSRSKYPNGFTVQFWYGTGYSEWTRVGELFKQNGAQIGINVDLQGVPRDQFFGSIEGLVPLWQDNWLIDLNEDLHLTPYYASDGLLNLTAQSDPIVDKALKDARATSDVATLKNLYGQFTEASNKEGSYITLYVTNTAHGVSNKLKGFVANPNYLQLEVRDAWLA